MTTFVHRLLDQHGHPVEIGRKIGSGGEGAVFEVIGRDGLVAKIYHSTVSDAHARKLAAMVSSNNPDLSQVAAWPSSLLVLAGRDARKVQGFLMPAVRNHHEIHRLYGPASRRSTYPHADWRFLVRAARNTAAAIAAVHHAGHVVGDLNQRNTVVADDATVKLVDCDSFQIRGREQWHLCHVGFPEYTAPELQGKDFTTERRTPEHDAFALAVLVFHLLFMGRHPFVGVHGGRDQSIEEAIKRCAFAFGVAARKRGIGLPPKAVPLEAVSEEVAALFERAFSPEAIPRRDRPSAALWMQTLQEFGASLRPCGKYQGHYYYPTNKTCPWCAIEEGQGAYYFTTTAIRLAGQPFDMGEILSALQALTPPSTTFAIGQASMRPVGVPAPPFPDLRKITPWDRRSAHIYRASLAALWLFAAALATEVIAIPSPGLAVLGAAVVVGCLRAADGVRRVNAENQRRLSEHTLRRQAERDTRERRLRDVTQQLETRRRQAESEARERRNAFDRAKRALSDLCEQYSGLPQKLKEEKQKLLNEWRSLELKRHLEKFEISDAVLDGKIVGIGTGRAAILLSYGIETAEDVTEPRILSIPGFGPELTRRLLEWRQQCERRFRPKGKPVVDALQAQRLEAEYATRRAELENAIRQGLRHLQASAANADSVHRTTLYALQELRGKVEQAEADVSAIS